MATQTTLKKIRNPHKKLAARARVGLVLADTLAKDIDAYGLHIGALTRNETIVVLIREGLRAWKAPMETAEAAARAMKGTLKEVLSEVIETERGAK